MLSSEEIRVKTTEELKTYLSEVKFKIKVWQSERKRIDNIIRNRK